MLRDVSKATRFLIGAAVLAGSLLATTVVCAAPASRTGAVRPTPAASSSTRRVAHVSGVHRHRHLRAHRTETSLRERPVAAATSPAPARVPTRSRVPRTSRHAAAPTISHRDGGARANGAACLAVGATSARSIAVLGTCVHQRTRVRLRTVSELLESRGPPRAGPTHTFLALPTRGAREHTAAPAPPTIHTDGDPSSGPASLRTSRRRLRLALTSASRSLERPFPDAARLAPTHSRCTGAPCPTRNARTRAGVPRCRPLAPKETP